MLRYRLKTCVTTINSYTDKFRHSLASPVGIFGVFPTRQGHPTIYFANKFGWLAIILIYNGHTQYQTYSMVVEVTLRSLISLKRILAPNTQTSADRLMADP